MSKTYYEKNGYDFFITINGFIVSRDMMTDRIIVTTSKNQAAIAEFTLLHPPGIQDPDSYQGADVTISVRCSTGIFRIFTGIIENPELDIITKKTTYHCSDNRDFKIKQLDLSYVHNIGVYSNIVFGEPSDITDELSKRLSTIPYYFNFDNYGNPRLISWFPKTSADFTMGASQIYYREPSVRYTARNKTINTVNINFVYEYQRCYQKKINYVWNGYSSLISWFRQGRPSFPTKEGIKGAANGVGWVVPSITFVPLWPAQGVQINGSVVIWQPNQVSSSFSPRVDSSGNAVTDASGNRLYDQTSSTVTDTSSGLCIGASWFAYKKWTQNVRENYTLNIYSPQSVAKYGENKNEESYTLVAPYEPSTWETSPIETSFNSNSFRNQDNNRTELSLTFYTILQKAYVTLLQAHRDVEVNFQTPIAPYIDLFHTVAVDMTKLECKGITSHIQHIIDIQTTEAYTDITLELSRMQGTSSQSSLVPPTTPTENTSYNTFISNIVLGTHLGVNVANFPNSNGYFGNRYTNLNLNVPSPRTTYPEAFIVDTPAIPGELRDTRELPKTDSYIISIPNDYLVVRY